MLHFKAISKQSINVHMSWNILDNFSDVCLRTQNVKDVTRVMCISTYTENLTKEEFILGWNGRVGNWIISEVIVGNIFRQYIVKGQVKINNINLVSDFWTLITEKNKKVYKVQVTQQKSHLKWSLLYLSFQLDWPKNKLKLHQFDWREAMAWRYFWNHYIPYNPYRTTVF